MADQVALPPMALGQSASSPCLSRPPSDGGSSRGFARSPASTTNCLMSPLASAGRVAVTNMGLPGDRRSPQATYHSSSGMYGSFYHDPGQAHKLNVQRKAQNRDFSDHMRATGMFRNRSFKTEADRSSKAKDMLATLPC